MEQSLTLSYLSKSSIFSALPPEDLQRLEGLVREQEFRRGDLVIHQGDFGDCLYFICRGQADVFITNEEGADNIVNRLGEGDFFGEMALLTGAPRSASVRLTQDSLLLLLFKKDFDAFLADHPHLAILFTRLLAERIKQTTTLYAHRLDREAQLRRMLQQEEEEHLTRLMGRTKQFQSIEKRIEELAGGDVPVLITGPEGTAAEDVARLIHAKGRRRDGPLMMVDLGGGEEWRSFRKRVTGQTKVVLEEAQLFESFQMSTLFGHERGSLPGAEARRLGVLELADGGTVVLKGLDRITPGTREKLISFLLDKKFYRFGGTDQVAADTSVITTIYSDIVGDDLKAAYQGRIPELFFRGHLELPSLDHRRRDIPLIAASLLEKRAAAAGKNISAISPQAMNTLIRYGWPGNDRELDSVIERGVMVCDGDTLLAEHIFLGLKPYSEKGRFNLLRLGPLRRLFANQGLRTTMRSLLIPILLGTALISFFGNQDPAGNPGTILFWSFMLPGLFFSFFFLGRIYCSICPIYGITSLTRRLFSLNRPAPRRFAAVGVSIAAFLCLVLFWYEEILAVRSSPIRTGVLVGILISLAVLANAVFRSEVWCRFLCPMGYMSGLSSCLAIIELRANNSICSTQCKATPCFKGDEKRAGCPQGIFPVTLTSNQHCKLCGTCVQNCPHNSIHLDFRWPGAELWDNREPSLIASLSALPWMGIAIPLFLHRRGWLPHGGWSFSAIYVAAAAASLGLFYLISLSAGRSKSKDFLAAFGFAYLPLAFCAHLAFQLPYFLFGIGLLFGRAAPPDFASLGLKAVQGVLLVLGLSWSLSALLKINVEGAGPTKKWQALYLAATAAMLVMTV